MGSEAEDILAYCRLCAEDSKVCETVKTKFEAHFVKKRFEFNLRKQEGEAIDSL